MQGIARSGAEKRDAQFKERLGVLSYELFSLTARQKNIEIEIGQLEAAIQANDMVRKDIETDAAIVAAQAKAKENDG